MPTSSTPLLGLALPVTGELSGTWGDTVNDSITSLVETSVAGTTTLATDADVTLTTTTLAANEARAAILNCTGARTALRTITAPAQSKTYTIINGTTGGYGVKIVGVGPTTGVTIAAGDSAVVAWNGTDFVIVREAILSVLQGGTGRATGTTAYALVATGTTATGAQQSLAAGATTEVLVGGGASALPVWTTATGSGAPVRATSPTLVTPALGTPASGVLTNCTSAIAYGIKSATTTVSVSAATAPTSGQVLTASSTTLASWVTPSVAIGSVSGLGTGVATFLATPSSANLLAAVTNETGTGALVFATSPTLVTPLLGTPTSGVLTNCTGTASGLSIGGSAGSVPLNGISNAAASDTLSNAAYNIVWNWDLASASDVAFTIGESGASSGGAGEQTLLLIKGLSNSTADPLAIQVQSSATDVLRVTATGDVTILGRATGAATPGVVSISSGTGISTFAGSALNLTAGNSGSLSNADGANVNITAGTADDTGQNGGDVVITTGTGATNGRVNFVNTNVANGSVATTITSLGPTGAATTIQGWLAIKVSGTARYVPYW